MEKRILSLGSLEAAHELPPIFIPPQTRDRDPRYNGIGFDTPAPQKGDRGWADLPTPEPLTGPSPFDNLRGGK